MGDIIQGVAALMNDDAEKTAESNLEMARQDRAFQKLMFDESRGSTGHAFLPTYLGNQEKLLGQDAIAFYNSARNLLGTPEQQLARYNAAINPTRFAAEAGLGSLSDVYNGNLTQSRIGYAQPVMDARRQVAQTQKQGIQQGWEEVKNRVAALNQKRGFSGTSGSELQALTRGTIGARQAAAGAGALANLQNAEDARGIYDQGAQLRLSMLGQPYQLGQQALNMEMLPMNQVQSNFGRSMDPFSAFRIGTQAFSPTPLPQQPVVPSAFQRFAPALGNMVNNAGTAFANYKMQQNYDNALAGYQTSNAINNLPVGYGTDNFGSSDFRDWSTVG